MSESPPLFHHLQVHKLEVDKQRAVRLFPLEIVHPDKGPSNRSIRQPHRRNGKLWVPSKAVVALDEHAQKHQLVVCILPLQGLVPDGIRGMWVLSMMEEPQRVVLVRLSLSLRGLLLGAREGAEQRTRQVRLDRVPLSVLVERHVRGASDVDAQPLGPARAKIAAAAASQGRRLEHVSGRATEEGVVELDAGGVRLPVEGADLGADAPVLFGVQIRRRDARALGEDAHQVLRVVARDLDGVARQVLGQAGL